MRMGERVWPGRRLRGGRWLGRSGGCVLGQVAGPAAGAWAGGALGPGVPGAGMAGPTVRRPGPARPLGWLGALPAGPMGRQGATRSPLGPLGATSNPLGFPSPPTPAARSWQRPTGKHKTRAWVLCSHSRKVNFEPLGTPKPPTPAGRSLQRPPGKHKTRALQSSQGKWLSTYV